MGLKFKLINKIKSWTNFYPKIHILSDSHGEAFKYVNWNALKLNASFCIIPGATASGLANPNSQTQALPRFKEYISNSVNQKDFMIVEFGEVDCGFAMWIRANREKITISEQLELTLKSYQEFLLLLSKSVRNKIIVVSAILPTISDNLPEGEIAKLRKEVKSSQSERTQLTLEFNKKLKNICELNNFCFLDLDRSLLDKNNGLVKVEFRNENPADHHLNPHLLGKLIEDDLLMSGYNFNQ